MKKQLLVSFSTVLLASSVMVSTPEVNKVNAADVYSKCQVFNTQIISKSGVNQIAKNREMLKNSGESISTFLSLFGKYGVPINAGVFASRNAAVRNTKVFADAADKGKRVKVTYCKGPTPNLPWYKYSIIN